MSFFRHAIPTTSTIIKNLIGWWKLGDSQTSAKSSFNNNNITLTNSPTINLNNSLLFNAASSQSGRVAINLSSYNKITLCFWLNVTSYDSNARVGLEYTADVNSTNGFLVLIDNSVAQEIRPSMHCTSPAGYQARYYARMPANETHFYSIIFDRTTGTLSGVSLYIDGNSQAATSTPFTDNFNSTNFDNSTLFIMSRNETSSYGNGALNDLRIYSGSLTQEEIKILYNLGPK